MTEEYERCSITRMYDLGTRTCPYCREFELKIAAAIEYDSESNKTEVRVHGNSHHLDRCRDERKMKLNNFVSRISNLKLCGNCEKFTEKSCEWSDGETPPSCSEYSDANQDFHALGTCGAWELKKKWYDEEEHQYLVPNIDDMEWKRRRIVDII